MAPSLLLDPESPPPSYVHNVKQTLKSDVGVSLKEAQAPVGGDFSFSSASMNGNGNGHANGANDFSASNGLSGVQQGGGDFVSAQTLRQQSENYASQARHVSSVKRPNILYIMADQMAAPMLKFNDPESVIKTPHLDELARTGVNFSSAYCNSPLCAPSRFTMCSGQLPSKIGGYDNASILGPEIPTYAHYLRREGYETALAGKMHFIGPDQLHGFEHRLTSDIYPGDLGWSVNWDKPEERQEWYHNMASVMQAGPCVRSNQLDYDEDVMHKAQQYLYDYVRSDPETRRPFALTISLTHPHDPYTMIQEYWDRYEGVDIPLPKVEISQADQDSHSQRLLKTIDLWDNPVPDEAKIRARRAYFAACSFVDDQVGKLVKLLRNCKLDKDTIVVFSGDHGDMLGERSLWYKMSWYENSARVPMIINGPNFAPKQVKESVSTMDLLPTFVDLAGGQVDERLPLDGVSLQEYLISDKPGKDEVFGEYMGEGTITPTYMIRRHQWKFTFSLADGPQLYNLVEDPQELQDLARSPEPHNQKMVSKFEAEAREKWDFARIHNDVLRSQRMRQIACSALKIGRKESWDYQPPANDRDRFIRSHIPLDELERRARFPVVDYLGREKSVAATHHGVAGAAGE
ncbi:choline sulfatase [Stemphylium lycopersici]|uniref:Choline sulfatase n=1 Tax=Stemphylium lycopersici TaxID=183478 RepID=A0A364MYJ4_STELY|nr:choline-sulfatase [Stemphylium lycopersici]RAR01809.1 choline sulfatase [Stemphylium lycopersici]RAR06615.1 choline sulfatase [Stemphylium lycopersici]